MRTSFTSLTWPLVISFCQKQLDYYFKSCHVQLNELNQRKNTICYEGPQLEIGSLKILKREQIQVIQTKHFRASNQKTTKPHTNINRQNKRNCWEVQKVQPAILILEGRQWVFLGGLVVEIVRYYALFIGRPLFTKFKMSEDKVEVVHQSAYDF